MGKHELLEEKERKNSANENMLCLAEDKQKVLLSSDTGHFSLIRAMHLADVITELNGM